MRFVSRNLLAATGTLTALAFITIVPASGRVCAPALDGDDASPTDVTPFSLPVAQPDPADALSSEMSQQSGQASANTSSESKAISNEDEARRDTVNPVTGLVTTTGADYQPLTGEERWKLYWKMNFLSVGAYFGPFFSALVLDQATGSPAQWGGGFSGYGRRVASRTGNAMLQGTIQAPLAAVLHEDVRYIASTQRSFKRRALHAIAFSFLTYNSHGHATLNIANIGAYYGSTAISTAWLPGHYNVASYAFSNSSEQIALTMPVNLLQEFWPELRRYVLRRH